MIIRKKRKRRGPEEEQLEENRHSMGEREKKGGQQTRIDPCDRGRKKKACYIRT